MAFTDKKVLITGSTRGIGFALAEHFLGEGALVAINGRDKAKVDEVLKTLGDSTRAFNAAGNLGSADECRQVVKQGE